MIVKKPKKQRPKNLNLFTIRLPVNAVVSIMHRASGVVLFLIQPLMLWALYLSLRNEQGYSTVSMQLQQWPVKLLLTGLAWAFFHHFYAGLRHLAMDVHWMTTLQKARFSSRVVLGLVVATMLFVIFAIWK
ncbi:MULTISPECIES: succinate dehydrogenase, cytochrome b556 subunit [unclassified Methylophilus]|uniref:succinate dehydrogenase, cytochrome b556 subunit n=1 Tax=unclassified Methylophilus TaxID=2630143 RepID=UPI00070137E1|nr:MULTISPECIES: succinate dehydrogenase, cytochrome b556 subunit [unclassified Methylophilus]KQT37151.1 succinate dehydrogenase [Methylophilus sp. Leaf416]KQT55678.1 succinate dehydrogenase [Methylophilus sp. Leaf459]